MTVVSLSVHDEQVPTGLGMRSPLVGRADDLDLLARAVGLGEQDLTATGVLLSGDAGVGKTRVLTELAGIAAGAGWRVATGHCLDFGESTLPYLPFTEMFGRLATDEPELAATLMDDNHAVARLMPGQRRFSADEGPHQVEPLDRAQLFESVHLAMSRLSEVAPLLVVIEDVHWADRSTREMLSFLFTRQTLGPAAVVASYRGDDLHRRHPLRATVAEWSRLPQVYRHSLRPLEDDDVRSLVRALHPAPLPERDLMTIIERAEGNAFFVEALLDAGDLEGRTVAADLADLLLVRIDQLEDAARQVVRAASVAGRRVSHDLLARVVALSDRALDDAVRTAVEANVLVAARSDTYAFRHALLAEAVYDDLLPGERVGLHSAYARLLAAGEVEGTAAELARHARAAGDSATAVRASVQAGDEAMTVGGPDEAARHYEVALELLADSSDDATGEPAVDVVALTVKAGEAAAAAGRVHRTIALLEAQLHHLPDDAPSQQRAQLLLALASATLLTDAGVSTLELSTAAIQLVPAEPPTRLRAQIAAVHARANADRDRLDDAATWASEAVAYARALGLPDVLADATTTLAHLARRAGDPESSLRTLEQSVAEARAAGEMPAELRGLFSLGGLHYELGRLDEARAAYELAAGRARAAGRSWAPYGLDARVNAAIVAYVAGDWSQVRQIVDVSGESPPALAEAALAAVGMQVSAGRGDPDALQLSPQLRQWWERDGLIALLNGSAAIDVHGDRGDLDSALAAHADLVATLGRLWPPSSFQARIRLSALLLGQLATASARVGAEARGALVRRGSDLADVATATAAAGVSAGRPRGVESAAWLLRVSAEDARLRWLTGIDPPAEDELTSLWQETTSAFQRFGHVFEAARSQARLAAVLSASGRSKEAAANVTEATEVARRLGAGPLLTELRVLHSPGRRVVSQAAGGSDQLTPREAEVLALVALGRSNREIGTHLFISTKTASVHVSNILAKLGAASRTEAVSLARERGDLPTG